MSTQAAPAMETNKRSHSNEPSKNKEAKKSKRDEQSNNNEAGDMNGVIHGTSSIQAAVQGKPEQLTVIPGLPEGFFDDPVKDAKARNIVLADQMDAEFEKFKREMQMEELKQEAINEIDDDVRDIDRELEEVDDLIHKWSKIEDLHQRKQEILSRMPSERKIVDKKKNKEDEDDDDEDDDLELDEVMSLKLRSKHRC